MMARALLRRYRHREPLLQRFKSTTATADWIEDGGQTYKNWINGTFVPSSASSQIDVKNPASQELVGKVPESTSAEVQQAIDVAQSTFKEWRNVPIQQRQRVMLQYQSLLREYTEDLAYWITLENGKTLADARGDVFRGLEVVESCCAIADRMMGETLAGVSTSMDCTSYRTPLGVCAGIGKWHF